jgi:hypothetical protein
MRTVKWLQCVCQSLLVLPIEHESKYESIISDSFLLRLKEQNKNVKLLCAIICSHYFAYFSATLSPQREALEAAEAAAKAKGKEGDAASGSGWLRYADTRAVDVFALLFVVYQKQTNSNSSQGSSEIACF